jgi:hypothetical protein
VKYCPRTSPKSSTCTIFGCVSCAVSFASSMNIVDEVRIRGQVRQDAFDDEDLLEAVRRRDLGAKHLGHAAHREAFEQRVTAKGRGRRSAALRRHVSSR